MLYVICILRFEGRYCLEFFALLVKVKESRKRPGVAQRVPGGLGSQISTTFGTWRWWGRQPHAPATFTPRKYSWYSFSLGAESTPGPWCCRKEICHRKNPVTPPGIDPGTFQLIAQRLKHYATPGPDLCSSGMLITDVSGRPVGHIFKGPAGGRAGPLKMKLTPRQKPETTQDTVLIFRFKLNPHYLVSSPPPLISNQFTTR